MAPKCSKNYQNPHQRKAQKPFCFFIPPRPAAREDSLWSMGSLSITMGSICQEAVPNTKFNNGTRNSDFAQCCTCAERLFFCRVKSLDWAKNCIELGFFLEVAYPWYCFQPHQFNQGLGFFSQQFLLLPCLFFLPSFLQKPLLPTTTTFSTSFPSFSGWWHLFVWLQRSHRKYPLVTEKAFKVSVLYFLPARWFFSSWEHSEYFFHTLNTIITSAQLQCLSYSTALCRHELDGAFSLGFTVLSALV